MAAPLLSCSDNGARASLPSSSGEPSAPVEATSRCRPGPSTDPKRHPCTQLTAVGDPGRAGTPWRPGSLLRRTTATQSGQVTSAGSTTCGTTPAPGLGPGAASSMECPSLWGGSLAAPSSSAVCCWPPPGALPLFLGFVALGYLVPTGSGLPWYQGSRCHAYWAGRSGCPVREAGQPISRPRCDQPCAGSLQAFRWVSKKATMRWRASWADGSW